jgi:hypothetical protein
MIIYHITLTFVKKKLKEMKKELVLIKIWSSHFYFDLFISFSQKKIKKVEEEM